jgi:hypothetical protein
LAHGRQLRAIFAANYRRIARRRDADCCISLTINKKYLGCFLESTSTTGVLLSKMVRCEKYFASVVFGG